MYSHRPKTTTRGPQHEEDFGSIPSRRRCVRRMCGWNDLCSGRPRYIALNEISAKQSKQGDDSNRAADREAIRKSADEFAKAFAKGDAKAVAAQWAEMGEVHEASGEVIVGRAEIEKAFAEQFKDAPKGSIEVDIRSIRFPSRDTAVEDGFLRYTPREAGLPSSTVYTAWHVREDGHWRLAYSREWALDKIVSATWHFLSAPGRAGLKATR